jgi:hypothetical protein
MSAYHQYTLEESQEYVMEFSKIMPSSLIPMYKIECFSLFLVLNVAKKKFMFAYNLMDKTAFVMQQQIQSRKK